MLMMVLFFGWTPKVALAQNLQEMEVKEITENFISKYFSQWVLEPELDKNIVVDEEEFLEFLETRIALIEQRRSAFEANRFYEEYFAEFQYNKMEFNDEDTYCIVEVWENFELDDKASGINSYTIKLQKEGDEWKIYYADSNDSYSQSNLRFLQMITSL